MIAEKRNLFFKAAPMPHNRQHGTGRASIGPCCYTAAPATPLIAAAKCA